MLVGAGALDWSNFMEFIGAFSPMAAPKLGPRSWMNDDKCLVFHLKGNVYTLPKTNGSHLKMDDWNTIASFWGPAHFRVLLLLVWGSVPKNVLIGFKPWSEFFLFSTTFLCFFLSNPDLQRCKPISKVMKGKGKLRVFRDQTWCAIFRNMASLDKKWMFNVQFVHIRLFVSWNLIKRSSPFIIFRSLITPSFGAPTGCQRMDSNMWNLRVMVTSIYSIPKIYDRSPVFPNGSTFAPVLFLMAASCFWSKSQKASVAVFCSSSCGQVYRAIGSNSDCCQWCDDWIPNGSLFVNSWVQRGRFTMGPRGSRKKWMDSNNGTGFFLERKGSCYMVASLNICWHLNGH